jgi:hypothetical protein
MVDKHAKGIFTEFVRSEVYNLLRWTATLSTFVIAASFVILDHMEGFTNFFPQNLFYVMMFILVANIGLTWWRIRRVIYKYYNELDHKSVGLPLNVEITTLDRISKFARFWETFAWSLFLLGFALFIYFLISYLI